MGILVARELLVAWWIWGVAAGVIILLGWWVYYWWRRFLPGTLFLLGLAVAAMHFSWVDEATQSLISKAFSEEASFDGVMVGRIRSAPVIDGNHLQMILRVKGLQRDEQTVFPDEDVVLQVRMRSAEEQQAAQKLQRGMTIQLSGQLERPSPARNPGAFDYRAYLYRQGIHWLVRVDGLNQLQIQAGRTSSWRGQIDALRGFLGERLMEIYPEEIAGLMRAMLLGERLAVPAEIERDFTVLGLVHLFAISGLHVGVFIACLYGLLKRTGITREKAAGMVILLLPGYVLLTGAGAPVIRAAVMAALALLAVILRRWQDGLSFLAVALLVMLGWNPYLLFEPGFQLSFLITYALLIGVGPCSRLFSFPWKSLNQLLAVTLVAQLASFPVVITHFYEYSLLSWLVNLIFVPIISLIVIPFGLASLILGVLHAGLAVIPAAISSTLLSGIVYVAEKVAGWYGLHLAWSPPTGWWLVGYAVVCFYLFIAWTGDLLYARWQRAVSFLLFVGLVGVAALPAAFGADELRVTFLDVGQGDAAVIETPSGKVIVVDGGGQPFFPREAWERRRKTYDVGERVLVPYLKYRGIRQIDYLVITHGDADHIGGLLAVAKQFPIRHVIRNFHLPGTRLEQELMAVLRENGARIHRVAMGSGWVLEPGVSWQFLNPVEKNGEGRKSASTNNDSVVFLLTAYGRRVLMTGDMEEEAEGRLTTEWKAPSVDVLKVAHHGSRTSSNERWLDTIQPAMAVISVGRENRFGHPSPEVLERLKDRQILTWRTDHHGAITLLITRSGMKVETMMEKE